MGVVSACAFSFMSKYLHQSCGPKPMTRVDINDKNQSSNKNESIGYMVGKIIPRPFQWYMGHPLNP
jgi:hypothetical protein